MRTLTLLTIVALLAPIVPARAQRAGPFPYDGDLQAYGAPWRYQHRDWSNPWRPLDPGVCWRWNDYMGYWKWEC
ncbi:MAG: hypothetical protein ACR650_07660 [Methylocystis sp.]|jgi:hypothetical protein